ncbi:dTDP-4-dehydrorhamnose reductase [Synechococcus sp. PCC 7336]|uniref:dTDP-4-dehydrorhamnose reductase n=1 Tax=Synechococcus sp. PCC 7336 TaxID=195250 RepID=UPI00034D42B5|nr:dTDP-4-dehydrorhamnose reductase [Synechococcus sp. PCC 7336]
MRILLLGSNGQVGRELQQPLAALGTVTCWGRQQLDLTQVETIRPAIEQLRPDAIVNAAAYTAVDRAESELAVAQTVNGEAPGQLALAAAAVGATLVHLSTDYVFAGDRGSPYLETDPTGPLGAYGQTKWAGEEAIRQHCDRHCILRTAWVYGAKGQSNFVKTMLRLGQSREELRVVADQVGSPTWAKDIAEAIAACLPKLGPDTYGTYHYTNSGVASWYDLAVAIFEEARAIDHGPLQIRRVEPIATADYPTPARRPSYSVLATAKIARLLGQAPPHWRASLRQMLQEYLT